MGAAWSRQVTAATDVNNTAFQLRRIRRCRKTLFKKSKIVATSGIEQVVIRMWHMVGVAMAGGKILIPDVRQGYSDVCFRVTQ